MDQWTVLDGLRLLTHLDGEGAVSEALPLCKSAAETVMRRVKSNADPSDQRLVRAAAAIAFYDLTLLNSSDEDATSSFKAGDVTVSRSPSLLLEKASLIKNEAIINALPLLRDEAFLFTCV